MRKLELLRYLSVLTFFCAAIFNAASSEAEPSTIQPSFEVQGSVDDLDSLYIDVAAAKNPNSAWTLLEIQEVIQTANPILKQCNISLNVPNTIYELAEAPVEHKYSELNMYLRVASILQKNEPKALIYFMFTEGLSEDGSVAFQAGSGLIVFSRNSLTPEYKLKRDLHYSPLAHEVGHRLGLPHLPWPEKNLMSGFSDGVNPILTQDQCAKIRKNLSKLLRRAQL